jgi:hypothetical protein
MWLRKRREPEAPLTEAERQFQLEHERVMRIEMRSGGEILKDWLPWRKKKRKRN